MNSPVKQDKQNTAVEPNPPGTLFLVGEIMPRTSVFVFPKVPGRVQELRVEVGDRVRKGDVLAVVEHEEIDLGIRQARAVLEAAKAALAQAKALSKVDVESKFQQAQAGRAAAATTVQQAEDLSQSQVLSQVAQAKAALVAAESVAAKAREGARKQEQMQVKAVVEQAKAGLDNAKVNFDRAEKLHEQGVISQQAFDAASTQLAVAEAQYDAARQRLDLVEEGTRQQDIKAAEAQVERARAALAMAARLEQTKSWEKDIALAEAKLRQSEALLKVANAALKSKTWEMDIRKAEMGVEQARTGVQLAQKKLSDATITAPISGTISVRNIELGGMAAPQQPMFQIVDMDVVKAKVSVAESDFYKVNKGDEAEVTVDAVPEPVKGTVTLVGPTLDRMTRTATVEISIPNENHRLRPGMFARARVMIRAEDSSAQ